MECFSIAPIACVKGYGLFGLPGLFGFYDWFRLFGGPLGIYKPVFHRLKTFS